MLSQIEFPICPILLYFITVKHISPGLEEEKLVHALLTKHLGMSAVVRPQRLSIFAQGLEDEMVGTWKFAEETSFLAWRRVTRAESGPLYENPARAFFRRRTRRPSSA